MTDNPCKIVATEHRSKIEEIIRIQKEENREAIFFMYRDGRSTEIFKGEPTSVSLSKDQETRIMSQGDLMSSIHSHPFGFDPSTIDIMTGLMTDQDFMCVATPIFKDEVPEDFLLTCLDLSAVQGIEKERMVRAMRRSSMGLSDVGRQIRKDLNMQRFNINGCRTRKVNLEGLDFPLSGRPSIFAFTIGSNKDVTAESGERDMY